MLTMFKTININLILSLPIPDGISSLAWLDDNSSVNDLEKLKKKKQPNHMQQSFAKIRDTPSSVLRSKSWYTVIIVIPAVIISGLVPRKTPMGSTG